jgi:hypothetical protein
MKDTVLIRGERYLILQCGTCAIWHTVPEVIYDAYSREGGFWHCPNGHQRGFRKGSDETERENTRRERDRLKQDAARLEEEIRAARERAEKAEAATKRLKKKAAVGSCPCCKRTFTNMARHMQTKHPEFKAEAVNVVPLRAAQRDMEAGR